MRSCLVVFAFIFQIFGARGFIVPDEIPTILSVIYSNIPVLKKGTDSRLGWGFRLGDRADFQVLVELGPQTYTQPLANQGDSGNSKRNTINSLSDTLYAQRQKEKLISNTDGGKWLEDWSNNAQKKKESNDIPSGARPGIAIGEIDAKSVIPDDSMQKFAQLYKEKSESADPRAKLTKLFQVEVGKVETTTQEVQKTTLEVEKTEEEEEESTTSKDAD